MQLLDIASSWWLHSTDHSSGDRPGWTNTKSTGRCLSIFVLFRMWIVWQLPSMVLKWKAPQSLLCHRSRQWQLQQCRSLKHNTTNTASLFLPPGFSFLVWFKFSLTLFQFIQRASFSKLFLKFRDKVYCHQMSISNELQPETSYVPSTRSLNSSNIYRGRNKKWWACLDNRWQLLPSDISLLYTRNLAPAVRLQTNTNLTTRHPTMVNACQVQSDPDLVSLWPLPLGLVSPAAAVPAVQVQQVPQESPSAGDRGHDGDTRSTLQTLPLQLELEINVHIEDSKSRRRHLPVS